MKPTPNLTYHMRNRLMGESVDSSHLEDASSSVKPSYASPHPESKLSSFTFDPLSFSFCQTVNPLGRNNTLSYYWSFITCGELRLWESVWEVLRKRIWSWEQKDVKIQEREKTSVRGKPPRKNCVYFVILPKFQDVLSSFLIDLWAAGSSSHHSNISL